jgi:hydroxyacylglutathione hydrolase
MEISRLVFSPIEVNTYILSDKDGKCAVIDCGCYDESEFEELDYLIRHKKLEPVLLLNTHCHLDHVFGNRMFFQKYNLSAYYHVDEEINIKNAEIHAGFFGLTIDTPPEPAGYLSDHQSISFGSEKLLALHVPGHAPGSLAFYSEKAGVVFTGDALFRGSIGRSDLPGGNHQTLVESITKQLFTLPQETVVYPGHGEATTIENEMNNNPYFVKN